MVVRWPCCNCPCASYSIIASISEISLYCAESLEGYECSLIRKNISVKTFVMVARSGVKTMPAIFNQAIRRISFSHIFETRNPANLESTCPLLNLSILI